MAPDYVKRMKPKGNKANKGDSEAKRSVLPVIFTILAIGGFIYFLYSIKDNAPDAEFIPQNKPLPKLVEQPAANTERVSVESALPQEPEPREYIKELENKEVHVDMPERDTSPTRPYLMQCGSFRRLEDAQSLKAKIAFQGLEAIVRSSEGKKGLWHRVILGPFATKRKAESARHRLARASINGCAIWFW